MATRFGFVAQTFPSVVRLVFCCKCVRLFKLAFHDVDTDTDTDSDSPDTPTSLCPIRAISSPVSSDEVGVGVAFHDTDTDTDIFADILARIVARMSACHSACRRNNFRKSRVSDVSASILARMSVSVSVSASWNSSFTQQIEPVEFVYDRVSVLKSRACCYLYR